MAGNRMIKDLITKQGIMIDITNACINQCGNCMRFCGYYDKPFYMDFDYFKKVVDSLHDFKGQIGIIGGEPTLHPDFVKMVEYIRDTYPYKKTNNFFRNPVKDINSYILNTNVDNDGKFKLFTCANTQQFYDNFELIDDVFDTFRFNDHTQQTRHFSVLVDYNDLGITDEEFKNLEDKCWVQHDCFATVTPKGGFFCEMAGALDMLYDGQGGFEITPDWWKRTRDEFGNQEEWCKHCGARLGLPMSVDKSEKDFVTKSVVNNLSTTKRIRNKQYEVITQKDYQECNGVWQKDKEAKLKIVDEICVSNNNKFLRPQHIDFVKTQEEVLGCSDWVVINNSNVDDSYIEQYLKSHTFNMGCLYYRDKTIIVNVKSQALKNLKNIDCNIWGYYDLNKIVAISDKDDVALKDADTIINDKGVMSVTQAKKKANIFKILSRLDG